MDRLSQDLVGFARTVVENGSYVWEDFDGQNAVRLEIEWDGEQFRLDVETYEYRETLSATRFLPLEDKYHIIEERYNQIRIARLAQDLWDNHKLTLPEGF